MASSRNYDFLVRFSLGASLIHNIIALPELISSLLLYR